MKFEEKNSHMRQLSSSLASSDGAEVKLNLLCREPEREIHTCAFHFQIGKRTGFNWMIHFDFNESRGFRGIVKWFSSPSVHQVYEVHHNMVYLIRWMRCIRCIKCTQYIILIRSSKIVEESFLQCISDINVGREGAASETKYAGTANGAQNFQISPFFLLRQNSCSISTRPHKRIFPFLEQRQAALSQSCQIL